MPRLLDAFGPRVRWLALATLFVLAVPLATTAQVPLPAWARSVEILEPQTELRSTPGPRATRRGVALQGARLPIVGRVYSAPCPTQHALQVAPAAYVCEHEARLTSDPPQPPTRPPTEHAFVRHDGTRAFARPADAELGHFERSYGRGFGLLVTARVDYRGETFIRTRERLYVRRSAVRPARPSRFAGVELTQPEQLGQLGWVIRDGVRLRRQVRGRVVRRSPRLQLLRVKRQAGPGWLQLADGLYVAARDVVRPRRAQAPTGLVARERWLDVDLERQILVAYQGDRPRYATLVSSGAPSPERRTVPGTFRIWVKLQASDMSDTQRDDVPSNYSVEAVPWVQYFDQGRGLHATLWHDRFGEPRSHGCINLSLRDARWLFAFTRPALPMGWQAIVPSADTPGTVVRIR